MTTETMEKKTLSEWLTALDIKTIELASRLGVYPATVTTWLNGKSKVLARNRRAVERALKLRKGQILWDGEA